MALKKDEKILHFPKKNSEKRRKKKVYRVDVRLPDGRRITKTFHRKFDAEQFKAELKIKKKQIEENGTDIDYDKTFGEFVKYWFEMEVDSRKASKTRLGYNSDLKNHILPILSNIKLKHLNYSHAKVVENSIIHSGKSNRTTNKVMMVLKTILNDAVKHSFLQKSPIKGYPELKEEPRPVSYWKKDEIAQFLEANKEDYFFDLYKFALNTGLRLGEICGLCWDRVDFEANSITISRTLDRNGLKNTTKSHRARYIPMNTNVRALLKNRFKTKISKYVFTMPDGSHLPYDHFTQRHFKKAQTRAKMERHIRFHDLRHTYASHFVMNGGDIFVLQKLLGHTDISTTMIYSHLNKEFIQSAAEIIKF